MESGSTVSNPFVDAVPKDGAIIPRSKVEWLKTAFTVGGVVTAPDADTVSKLLRVCKIIDPDLADVTSTWVTNDLDPDDSADTYNASHAKYVGLAARRQVSDGVTNGTTTVTSATAAFTSHDVGKKISGTNIPAGATIQVVVSATQVTISAAATGSGTGITLTIGEEAIGLFADGNGRFARKVKPPSGTEITSTGDGSRYYQVEWKVLRGGVVVTRTERFHVGPEGVLIFDLGVATAAEVKDIVDTILSDAQVEAIIEHAEREIDGWLELLDIDSGEFAELPKLVRSGTIKYAAGLVCRKDKTAGAPIASHRQQNKRIDYAARPVDASTQWFMEAKEDIILYAHKHHDITSRRADVTTRTDWWDLTEFEGLHGGA